MKKYLKKLSATILTCLQIATILPLSFFTLLLPQKTFADNTAFCATVTDVPASECIVLLDFYDAANGPAWTNNTNWGTSTTVGTWYGVTVSEETEESEYSGVTIPAGHVTHLSLYNQNLSGTLPSLSGLPYLLYLTIIHNQLTSITPGAFAGLTNLIGINLSNNQLTSLDSDLFDGLGRAWYLDLSNNQLTSLDPNLFQGISSSLTDLILSNNQLTSLPAGVFTGAGIWGYVYLSGNCITGGEDAGEIAYANDHGSDIPNDQTGECTPLDTTLPLITLLGDNPLTLEVGTPYIEPGATAEDEEDGDISNNIIINNSSVDTNTPGTYYVTYNVSDSSDNHATQLTRVVQIVDTTPPEITNIQTQITTPPGAIITFTTNEPSTITHITYQVVGDNSTQQDITIDPEDYEYNTSNHHHTIQNLNQVTTYEYTITIQDEEGNTQTLTGTFTTQGIGAGGESVDSIIPPTTPSQPTDTTDDNSDEDEINTDTNTESDNTKQQETEETKTNETNTTNQTTQTTHTPSSPLLCQGTQETVEPYLTQYIKRGTNNNPEEVKKLQTFLNQLEGEKLVVDGIYKQTDYEAVKRFQEKYSEDILQPWNTQEPTGYVYETTVKKINQIMAESMWVECDKNN